MATQRPASTQVQAHTVHPRGRPPRVLWLIKGLGAGGAELLLSMLAEVRDRVEYEAAYLLPWKDAVVPELRRQGVRVHCLYGGRDWNLGWAFRLRRMLMRERYDIVHVHSPYVAGIARLTIRTMPRRSRPRSMSTEHLPWGGHRRASRWLNAVTYPLDSAHIAVSHAVQGSIPRSLRENTDVVVHGIFLDRVREQARHRDEVRREFGFDSNAVVIGTVANLRPNKGYPTLLRAARVVLDAHPEVRFVAVGQGKHEAEVRVLHEALGLDDRFLFAGYREDATRVMAGFDIFALTSRYEGLPLAVMEALTLGLPVVASAIPGVREELRDGIDGILVPAESPGGFASSLSRLVTDADTRAEMGVHARELASRYDIRIAARQIEGIYHDLLVNKPRAIDHG